MPSPTSFDTKDDRCGERGERAIKCGEFGFDVAAGLHQIGKPERQAIDEDRPLALAVFAKRCAERQRFLDRFKAPVASYLMFADARRHFVIAGFGGRQIDRRREAFDEGLGKAAFARAYAAQNESDGGKRVPLENAFG